MAPQNYGYKTDKATTLLDNRCSAQYALLAAIANRVRAPAPARRQSRAADSGWKAGAAMDRGRKGGREEMESGRVMAGSVGRRQGFERLVDFEPAHFRRVDLFAQ
jgi:hypothetical protein